MQDYSTLPDGLQGGMKRYVEDGILPGNFLTAILENDQVTAVFRADDTNVKLIPDIVKWVHWEIPNSAWGSKENVTRWMAKFTLPLEVSNGR